MSKDPDSREQEPLQERKTPEEKMPPGAVDRTRVEKTDLPDITPPPDDAPKPSEQMQG